jgi:hypothetical protein
LITASDVPGGAPPAGFDHDDLDPRLGELIGQDCAGGAPADDARVDGSFMGGA